MNNNTIQLSHINKSFNKQKIIDNLDLTIHRGEIIAFVGNNGSGKSTILKMIAGLIYQDSGEINVFGTDNRKKRNLNLCEFVLESGQGYYGYLTAYENARYFFGLNKIHFPTIKKEFESLCEVFHFTPHLHKKVDALSQGNRQKLSIIVALLSHPQILLLDEPTNGLDNDSILILTNILLKKNKNDKLTILMTTHDFRFTEMLQSKLYSISQGRIDFDASPIQYMKSTNISYNIYINIEEYSNFKKTYPNIEVVKYEDTFEVNIDSVHINDILTKYDVLKLYKMENQ